MLKLYTDKSEIFECNVALEGVDIKDSKIRAILKFNDKNLMIEGKYRFIFIYPGARKDVRTVTSISIQIN